MRHLALFFFFSNLKLSREILKFLGKNFPRLGSGAACNLHVTILAYLQQTNVIKVKSLLLSAVCCFISPCKNFTKTFKRTYNISPCSTMLVLIYKLLIFQTNFDFTSVTVCLTCSFSIVHCVQKKTPTYIFNYNSGISWSIFIIFIPVEREMNTLQYTYLQS